MLLRIEHVIYASYMTYLELVSDVFGVGKCHVWSREEALLESGRGSSRLGMRLFSAPIKPLFRKV